MSETVTVAEKLRRPFPAEQIGKLPRGGTALDYVGHADVTSRLLEADPEWNWEPLATDEHGLPLFDTDSQDRPVGLWIKLTAGGVTRLGYGSVPSSQSDAVKVLIGDALRNAAMRFGVALDLWAKGDRADPTRENATAAAGQAARRPRQQSAGAAFENATPAPPRQPNGHANGNVTRPPAREQAPAASGEPDEEAQPFADEVHEARTVAGLKDVHTKVLAAHKLAAMIRNPTTGGVGGLGQYIGWKKHQLEEADAALSELVAAATAAGILGDALDAHVSKVTGKSIEDATAAQLQQAARALPAGVPA